MANIPKIIFQSSKDHQYDYVIDMIKEQSPGWEYKHFNHTEMVQYIKNNPLDEFPNIIEVINSFTSDIHKTVLFRYYYLYINGGVFLDIDTMLERDLDIIVKDYDFFTVNSVTDKTIYNGFIGAIPKHEIIYNALKLAYTINNNSLQIDNALFTKQLYTIIEQFKNNNSDANIKIFYEKITLHGKNECANTYNDKLDHLLTHYYDTKIVPFTHKTHESRKILGVTIRIKSGDLGTFFTCGLHQNALYFGDLLQNIGYEMYFIVPPEDYNYYKNIPLLQKYKFVIITDNNSFHQFPFDIIFINSYTLDLKDVLKFKESNVKIILYSCGNDYFIISENIIYSFGEAKTMYVTPDRKPWFDECWIIPQHINSNFQLKTTMNRCKCIAVPFIWSPMLLEESAKNSNANYNYINRGKQKNISIFEPNFSIIKWALPPLIICENVYRKSTEKIEHVYVCNIDKNQFNLGSFQQIVNTLDLQRDKKVSIEGRFNTLYFMQKYADVVVSHQMENNLNYLWLDLAWYGWPVIHNGSLCSDIGYYYNQYDYEEGGNMLSYALDNHDNEVEEYTKRNRQLLNRYLPTNPDLHNKYISLVENVLVDQMFTKILYINLDRREDRNEHIKQQLKQINWTGKVERISAVDGVKLDLETVSHLFVKEALVEANTDYPNFNRGSYLTKGAVGCALSHREAYLNIQNGDDDYVLIIEDDVEFADNFNQQIKECINKIPNYDILYLGNSGVNAFNKINEMYSIPTGEVFGAFAMVINKRVIPKLLNIFPLTGQIDSLLKHSYKDINAFYLNTRLITTEGSDICRIGTDVQLSIVKDINDNYNINKNVKPINQMFTKILYINLDRRQDRNEHIKQQLKQVNWTGKVERISAIDGSVLDISSVSHLLGKDAILQSTSTNLPKMPPGYYITKGAVGCALSHREAYLNIQNGDDEYVLIIEDDIELDQKFNEKLLKCMNQIPDYDILYLGYHDGSKITKVNDIYSIPHGVIFGTGAMVINKRAISKLLTLFPLLGQIDSNLQLMYKDLNVYLVTHRIVHSENARTNFGTDIQQ